MNSVRNLLFRHRIWWHILFWTVWYFFYTFTYSSGLLEKKEFIQNLYLLPVRMAATYSIIYWLLPTFLFKKKYILFFILTIVHGILFGMAVSYTLGYVTGISIPELVPFIRPLVLNYQIPATAVAIYMFKRWYLIQQYTLNLEKEKLEAELKHLKSQIHPHFLFNTLNNLYALTLMKSDKAPDMVIQLSDLLEYSLYSDKESEVDLQEELKHLGGYIELEKLRYGKRLDIKTDFPASASGYKIAPLLLLPFVENSFKHGASNDLDSSFIEIKVLIKDNHLHFQIRNSYHSEPGATKKYKEGIGLQNVRRRLELLYPDSYQFDIHQHHEIFEVLLTLELKYETFKSGQDEI